MNQQEQINNAIAQLKLKFPKINFERYIDYNIDEMEVIEISISDCYDGFSFDSVEFLEWVDDFLAFSLSPKLELVSTKLKRYYIIEIPEASQEALTFHCEAKARYKDTISLDIVAASPYLAFGSILMGEDLDLIENAMPNIAIELIYDKVENVVTAEDELNIINSYIFEISDTFNIPIKLSTIEKFNIDDYHKFNEEKSELELRPLLPFNHGMKLFNAAIQTSDDDLKFLNFYKILEFFSITAAKQDGYELLRKKLDCSRQDFDKGHYIQSLFDLVKSIKDRFNDEDLIKLTFGKCFDFISLMDLLPLEISKKARKNSHLEIIDYSLDQTKLTQVINTIAKIIYSTRNKVVHAKSNYRASGDECLPLDLPQLNLFMKAACSQSIRWYNRQPPHLKLDI